MLSEGRFIPLACCMQAAASTWRRFFCKIFFIMRKRIVCWILRCFNTAFFSYHWFLCLCKTPEIFSHGGFCCFPPMFASMWGRDQTHFHLIVKRRLPWKPRWILQGSPSRSLRSETNLNLGKRGAGEQGWEVWLLTQPHCSCLGQVLLSPGQWWPSITICCYSSHFSATITWLLSSCRHREQTQGLPTLAENWSGLELVGSTGCDCGSGQAVPSSPSVAFRHGKSWFFM